MIKYFINYYITRNAYHQLFPDESELMAEAALHSDSEIIQIVAEGLEKDKDSKIKNLDELKRKLLKTIELGDNLGELLNYVNTLHEIQAELIKMSNRVSMELWHGHTTAV